MDLRQFEHLNVNNTKHTVPFRVRTNIITITPFLYVGIETLNKLCF